MLSLLGSVLGFGTSLIPKLLGYFEEKRDQKHELEMMDKQLQHQLQLGNQKMQLMEVDASIREIESLHKEHSKITVKSSQWVINLSSTVRPLITYFLFGEFILLTGLLSFGYIDNGMFSLVWSSEISAVWSSIVCFWFGQRTFSRK
tara:strand:+ start:1856 stop:2293 length:438 start_codon:yes stop_codon:yes gene_type:complete